MWSLSLTGASTHRRMLIYFDHSIERVRFNHGEMRMSQQLREHGAYRAWDERLKELNKRGLSTSRRVPANVEPHMETATD